MDPRSTRLVNVVSWVFTLALGASCVDPFKSSAPADSGPGAPRSGSGGTEGSSAPAQGGSRGAESPMGGSRAGGSTGSSVGGASAGSGPGGAGMGGGAGAGGAPGSGGAPGAGGAGQPDAGAAMDTPGNMGPPVSKPDARELLKNRRCEPLPDLDVLDCPLGGVASIRNWLPVTPPLGKESCFPQPHPADECPFYQPTVKQYMIAAQPIDAAGKPFFLTWNTIENTFGAGRDTPTPDVPVLLGGITQAGGRRVLVDVNGSPVYYGIHMNKVMVDFIKANGLDRGAEAVKNADPELELPEGAVTTKEAWMVVVGNPPANFITTRAKVPTFKKVGAELVEDHTVLRDVTLQMIGIHVVHVLPGHPEMIWGTFQHKILATGQFDIAPTTDNKNENDPTARVVQTPGVNYVLFPPAATKNAANVGRPTDQLTFDEATQKFTGQSTPVFRLYPASKSHTADEDEAITKLNNNVTTLFADAQRLGQLPANERRQHYRFVGAAWHDVPQLSFAVNEAMTNDETIPGIKMNGSDDPLSITAGEDRLSGVALESFTQGVNSFPGCFSCHDTRATTKNGIPAAVDLTNPPLMGPKKINVSHIFNEVVRLGLK